MDGFLSDLRHSLVGLRRSPWLAATAVVALAMGIGFTTTMFSIVRGGTRNLPFDQSHELMAVTMTDPRRGRDDVWPFNFDYVEWTTQQRSFEGLGGYLSISVSLSGGEGRPERRPAARVTSNTFSLLGALPLLGRGFTTADAVPGAPSVAIMGFDLWRTRFAMDSGIVGRAVRLDGRPVTEIGVMAPKFGFPINSHVWLPLEITAAADSGARRQIQMFGRLKDGVTREMAAAETATLVARSGLDHPDTHEGKGARVFPFVETETPTDMVRALYLMVGAVSFVLLIACANVASLLLARAAGRSRETAIRAALGATRQRLVTLHLLEAVVLSGVGGVIGLGIAYLGVRFFGLMSASILEAFWVEFRVDGVVVLFAVALTTIAAMAAGRVPALKASAANVTDVLKDQSGGTTGLKAGKLARALVVGEVALATGFLITTVSFVKSALALRLRGAALEDPEQRARYVTDLAERLNAIPGAGTAAISTALPGRSAMTLTFAMDGVGYDRPEDMPTTDMVLVTPEYFEVLGSGVIRGRNLAWQDVSTAPGVAVVNESFARRFSPGQDPLGRRIHTRSAEWSIVGVVPDLLIQDIDSPAGDGVYLSLLQGRPYLLRVLVGPVANPLSLTPQVWDAVRAVDPDVPVYDIVTLREAIYKDSKILDAMAALFFAFGTGALFLTVIGLYGIVAFAVSRRTREIGIRVALGARPRDVAGLVLKQGAREVGLGTAIGLLIAFGLAKGLSSALDIIEPANPVIYVLVVSILLSAALIGLAVPVRRALRLNPARALGSE